jgi:hypothetical protein
MVKKKKKTKGFYYLMQIQTAILTCTLSAAEVMLAQRIIVIVFTSTMGVEILPCAKNAYLISRQVGHV